MSILKSLNCGTYLPISAQYLASLGYMQVSLNGRYNIWQSPKYHAFHIKEENGIFVINVFGNPNMDYLVQTIHDLHYLENIFE